MIKKLRWKFVLVTTAFSMLVLSLVLAFSFVTMKSSIARENEETLHRIADMQQVPIMGFPGFQSEHIATPFFVVDVSRGGALTNLRSNYIEVDNEENRKKILEIVEASLYQESGMGVLEEESLRFYRKRQLDGWRMVYIDMSMEQNTIQSLQRNILFIELGSLLGIFLLSLGLAYWITKPVEQAWNQQRQFVADASHELKTPLTVILSNTDMLLNHGMNEGEQTQRRLGNIRAESVRMKELVEDMLYLARTDSGATQKQMGKVSLSDIVMDSVLLFEALAFEKEKELQYQLEESLSVLGSENSLKQLLEILLDNAMKYSDEKGHIWVKLERNTAKTVKLMVANTGETMTAEQCKRIFERFYRTDPARAHNGGYGLGLAIASSIVQEMGGKIWCESQNSVISFFVQFSLYKEAFEQ